MQDLAATNANANANANAKRQCQRPYKLKALTMPMQVIKRESYQPSPHFLRIAGKCRVMAATPPLETSKVVPPVVYAFSPSCQATTAHCGNTSNHSIANDTIAIAAKPYRL